MSQVWSGIIDSRLDVIKPTGQLYTCYVFTGQRRQQTEPTPDEAMAAAAAAAADSETAAAAAAGKERVILRDRDLIPLPHVGEWLHLAVDPAPKNRAGVSTYVVRRVLGFRAAHRLTRLLLARGLCNGIAQCRALIARPSNGMMTTPTTTDSSTKQLVVDRNREVPVTAAVWKYVGEVLGMPAGELSLLLKSDDRLGNSLFPSIANHFVARHVFFDDLFARLSTALRTHPLTVPASALHACSATRLESLISFLEYAEAFTLLFGSSICGDESTTFAQLPLSSPLQLEHVPHVQQQVGWCTRQQLDPLFVPITSTMQEFERSTTLQKQLRDLRRQARHRLPECSDADLAVHVATNDAASRPLRYGRTAFAFDSNDELEALGVWLRLPSSIASKKRDLCDYTTPLCWNRAIHTARTLAQFDSVTLVTVDGSCAFLRADDLLAATSVQRGDVPFIVAPASGGGDEFAHVTPFTVDDLLAASDWGVRALASVSNVLVLCDAHALPETDLLHCLLAYRRIIESAQPLVAAHERRALHVVLVGDQWQSATGWCAGSSFADAVGSRRFLVVESDALWRADVHPLAALAACAHFSPTTAEMVVDELLARRRPFVGSGLVALRRSAQIVVWVNSMALLGAFLSSLHEAERQPRKRSAAAARPGNDDDDDNGNDNDNADDDDPAPSVDKNMLALLERLRTYPHLTRDNVLVMAPYVLYNGSTMRVKAFYRLVRWPARNDSINASHCTPILPDCGLVSLDADSLLLELGSTTVDHRVCCNTDDPNLLRVACHRAELRAASIILGRDAAAAHRLAADVAVCVVPNASRTGPMLRFARWNETALGLVRLPPNARVELIAPSAAGSASSLGAALVDAISYVRRKQPTALEHALTDD